MISTGLRLGNMVMTVNYVTPEVRVVAEVIYTCAHGDSSDVWILVRRPGTPLYSTGPEGGHMEVSRPERFGDFDADPWGYMERFVSGEEVEK